MQQAASKTRLAEQMRRWEPETTMCLRLTCFDKTRCSNSRTTSKLTSITSRCWARTKMARSSGLVIRRAAHSTRALAPTGRIMRPCPLLSSSSRIRARYSKSNLQEAMFTISRMMAAGSSSRASTRTAETPKTWPGKHWCSQSKKRQTRPTPTSTWQSSTARRLSPIKR